MLSSRRFLLLPVLLLCLGCRMAAGQASLLPTQVTLALCVDGTQTSYPCSVPLTATPVVPSLSMFYGQVLDGDAVISPSGTTGSLTFSIDGVVFCTLPASGGTCPATAGEGIAAGVHTLTASYSGDATYAASTSNIVTVTVLPDPTTAALASSRNPAPVGQAVTFTTTLTGSFAAPTGTVTFFDGATAIGTGTLTAAGSGAVTSTATLTTSALAAGTHSISAIYGATQDFLAASTLPVSEVITPLTSTATSLASSLNPSIVGENVVFTASVTAPGSSAVPTGTVTFLDGTTVIGTGALTGAGVATLTTASLAAGSHNMTASYGGDTANAASVSAVRVQVVNPALPAGTLPFTMTVTPSPVSVGVGLAASLLVTVTEASGYSQPVALGCGSLPTEAVCTFALGTIPAGGGTTTLLVSTMAPHDCGATTPYFVGTGRGFGAPFAVPVLAGLVVLLAPGRRRWLKGLLAMVAVAALIQATGCGHCTDLGTRPGSYAFQVTGSAPGTTGGTQTSSVPVALNVTL